MKIIYIRKNLVNGKCYVGQTRNIIKRNYNWIHDEIYGNYILTLDRDSFGTDKFETIILRVCKDDEADKWENYYINEYNTIYPNGYNIKAGGISGWKHTTESKQKMSETKKELYKTLKPYWSDKKRSDSDKRKMSLAHNKKVYQYTIDGTLVKTWNSTIECASNGFNQGHVAACCRGIEKQHKGFKWSYEPL